MARIGPTYRSHHRPPRGLFGLDGRFSVTPLIEGESASARGASPDLDPLFSRTVDFSSADYSTKSQSDVSGSNAAAIPRPKPRSQGHSESSGETRARSSSHLYGLRIASLPLEPLAEALVELNNLRRSRAAPRYHIFSCTPPAQSHPLTRERGEKNEDAYKHLA